MGMGFYLSIAMLPVMIIITTIFFLKEKIKNDETEIYSLILLSSIAMTIFEILSALLFKYSFESFIYSLIAKLVLVCYLIIFFLFCKYIMKVCNRNKKEFYILYIFTIITLFLITLIKTQYIQINDGIAPNGIPILSIYIYSICLGVYEIILTILHRKTIIKKKFTPFYLFLLFGSINILIIYFFPTSFMVGYIICLVILIMNFTIENPDVKMAKELAFQRKLADASSDKTLELLNEISDDLNSSIKKIDIIGNKKIDKNNIDELNKEISEFQSTYNKLSDKISSIIELAIIKNNSKIHESKYETYDMLDRLKQLLYIDKKSNNSKLNIEISDKLPPVLYGDENNVNKIVLFLYNSISAIIKDKNILLKIDSYQVGRFSRLRFKFIVPTEEIKDYVYINNNTKELEIKNVDEVNYQIIEKLLKRFNGKLTLLEENDTTAISLFINQRLLTEYDIISNNNENKNIKIKYHDYSGKRILIVDNNNTKIKEIKVLLKPYNVEVYSANTPIQVSNILNGNATFDLILIDDVISNYKINEFTNEIIKSKDDILRDIKKDAKYPITTIIMVTPNYNNIEKKYLDFGFSDYIIKPINKENLDEILVKYFSKN